VRVSAKAVIIRDRRILVIAHRDDDGEYYVLPRGGQEPSRPRWRTASRHRSIWATWI